MASGGAIPLPSIIAGGERRILANLPVPSNALRGNWNVWGSSENCPAVPRSEWDSLVEELADDFDPFLPPVHDQNGIGCCNASATVAAMESARLIAGLPAVSLSAGDLYGRINGGRDQGSFLEDGLRVSMDEGVASINTCDYLEWRKKSRDQEEDRKFYRVLEAFLCPTFDACFSAVLRGCRLISGVMWYDSYEPDSDGWLPRGTGGGGGHAVFGYKATRRRGEYGIWHQNSWASRWGKNGRCVFPERAYSGPVGGWWAVRVVTAEEQDLPAPAR